MFNKKFNSIIVGLLLVSMSVSGCATLFPTQRMIDDILPNNERHYYCDADLIPYSKEELTNATMLYGQELSEYYFMNVDKYDEQIVEEVDEAGKEEFMARLTYMNSNYKLLKARYEKYAKEEGATEEDFKKVDKEFNDFYKLPNSKFSDTVKANNGGQLAGCPEVSLTIDVNTIENNNIYYEATAKVFKHVILDKKKYSKMVIGDKITLDFPEVIGDATNGNVRKAELVLIATDSFIEYNTHPENDEEVATDSYIADMKKSKDSIYYVTPNDPMSKSRTLINADGNVIELYQGEEVVQIMKDARIAQGIDETRLVTQILREDPGVKNYTINEICDAHEGGGYVDEDYKNEIYLNNIYTNLKGYITSGYRYEQMYIDNEYARQNNTKYQTAQEGLTNNNEFNQEDYMNGNQGFDSNAYNSIGGMPNGGMPGYDPMMGMPGYDLAMGMPNAGVPGYDPAMGIPNAGVPGYDPAMGMPNAGVSGYDPAMGIPNAGVPGYDPAMGIPNAGVSGYDPAMGIPNTYVPDNNALNTLIP